MSEQKWTYTRDKDPHANGRHDHLITLDDGDEVVLRHVSHPAFDDNVEYGMRRACACVNALAGIPDPSAHLSRVAAMEEALRVIDNNRSAETEDAYVLYRKLVNSANAARAALAKSALEGGGCNGK